MHSRSPPCTCPPDASGNVWFSTFIAYNFHECLYTTVEVVSFVVGMSSILFWLGCQLPQFITNCRRKSGAALSMWFLVEWLLGDITNLAGCILSRQLITQLSTSIFFVACDITMLTQVACFTARSRRLKRLAEEGRNDSVSSLHSPLKSVAAVFAPLSFAAFFTSQSTYGATSRVLSFADVAAAPLPRCDAKTPQAAWIGDMGIILGWVSAVLYLNSRIPQIWKNYKRKAVDGLSWVMFFCAVMGNVTYALGVFLRDSSPKALLATLPWLVGSVGTVCLDGIILFQFWIYRHASLSSTTRTRTSSAAGDYAMLQDGDDSEDIIEYDENDIRGVHNIRAWHAKSPRWTIASRVQAPGGIPPHSKIRTRSHERQRYPHEFAAEYRSGTPSSSV